MYGMLWLRSQSWSAVNSYLPPILHAEVPLSKIVNTKLHLMALCIDVVCVGEGKNDVLNWKCFKSREKCFI